MDPLYKCVLCDGNFYESSREKHMIYHEITTVKGREIFINNAILEGDSRSSQNTNVQRNDEEVLPDKSSNNLVIPKTEDNSFEVDEEDGYDGLENDPLNIAQSLIVEIQEPLMDNSRPESLLLDRKFISFDHWKEIFRRYCDLTLTLATVTATTRNNSISDIRYPKTCVSYVCVMSSENHRSKSKGIRRRIPAFPCTNCPFKVLIRCFSFNRLDPKQKFYAVTKSSVLNHNHTTDIIKSSGKDPKEMRCHKLE